MNKEYFSENISVEKMAALIDKTIKFEKNNKKDRFKNMNIIYKIVPAVAAVALIFGAVNLPIFKNFNNPSESDANAYISTTELDSASLTTSIISNSQINTVNDITDNSAEEIERLTININPKNVSKWQGFTGSSYTINNNAHVNTSVISSVTINSGAYKADGIEIYFTDGTALKTHDTVKIDEEKIIIAGNTFIDGNGNIIENGKGKFTIADKNGIETSINGGNQSRYTGTNPDGDANESYNKDGVKSIVDFLPYMSQKAIDSIARADYEKVSKLNKVDEILLATMSTDLLGEFAQKEYEATGLKNISDTVLAFMSEETVDKFAEKVYEKNGLKGLDKLLWAMSEDILDELALKEYDATGLKNISDTILTFMSEGSVDKLAEKVYEKNGLKGLDKLLWAMSEDILDELVMKEYDATGLKNISDTILTFMSEGSVDKLALKQLETTGTISSNILPFVSDDIIFEIAGKQVETKGSISSSMLPFASEKAVDDYAKKEYDKNGFKNLTNDIWVFMSEKAVDEIARKEYDKNGFKNFPDMLFVFMSDELICELVTDESSEYWNKYAWTKRYDKENKKDIFTLKDGTIIETASQYSTYADLMTKNSEKEMYGFMQPTKSITIKLTNGITITAPGGTTVKATPVKNADHKIEITIGSGNATIKKADGTSSALSKGAVLDGKGNIVK